MSLDLVVMPRSVAPDAAAAHAAYESDRPGDAEDASLLAFLADLESTFEESPWSAPPTVGRRSVALAPAADWWDDVVPQIVELASRHDLVVLDPQSGELCRPGTPASPSLDRRQRPRTKREFERFARRYLLPSLPGFVVRGNLMYRVPVEELLRSFVFERAAYGFTVKAAVQPLYAPRHFISLLSHEKLVWIHEDDWEMRIAGTTRPIRPEDDAAEVLTAIRERGLPFLDRFRSPSDYAREGIDRRDWPHERMFAVDLEAVGYSHLLAGNVGEARAALDEMLRRAEPGSPEHMVAAEARAARVLAALDRNVAEARAILAEYRRETLTALKLDEAG
jgi:hypothetical protein